jgi:hypothetical protein
MTRENIAELIADFCGPLGPEVFAGYATGLQQRRVDWGDDAEKYLEESEAFVTEWAGGVDVENTLAALLDLLVNPPGKEFHNGFCERLKDDWEYGLSAFFWALARRNHDRCRESLRARVGDHHAGRLATSILEGIEE